LEEYLDILTENGISTELVCSKDEAHLKGLFHATVHIWFYTKTGMVLFQKRAANKETFPNYWDVSVAGHVMSGESIESAALREVAEEIGLTIKSSQLETIEIRKSINEHPNGITDCEFQNVFLCLLDVPFNQLKKQDEEVDALCLKSLEAFKHYTIHHNEDFQLVPADYSYYTFIIDHITKVL